MNNLTQPANPSNSADPVHPVHPVNSANPVDPFGDSIANLDAKLRRLSRYIDDCWSDLTVKRLASLLSCHARNVVWLGRMLRDRRDFGVPGPLPVQLDPVIADLDAKLRRLSQYMDDRWPAGPGAWQWVRLVRLWLRNHIRLSELQRHRDALRDAPLDDLDRAIDAALRLLPGQWDDDDLPDEE